MFIVIMNIIFYFLNVASGKLLLGNIEFWYNRTTHILHFNFFLFFIRVEGGNPKGPYTCVTRNNSRPAQP